MAEELISIPPPASNAPKYYYPQQFYYAPEPYHTTTIPSHHFHEPDHRPSALENVRHAIGHAFHSIEKELAHSDNDPLPPPHADIRESRTHYYIDVELPGAHDKRNITLKWTGLNTLYLSAVIRRQPTPEEEREISSAAAAAEAQEPAAETAPAQAPAAPSSEMPALARVNSHEEGGHLKTKQNKANVEKTVYLIKHERRFGRLARAFAFSVPVHQDQITAKLAYGVLSITVPKVEADKKVEHKHVDIEHEGH